VAAAKVRRERDIAPAPGNVRKAGFIVLAGSGLGTVVSFMATPLISRLFEPAVYGRFALITGVVSVFVGVSTFRLEVQSLRVDDPSEAAALIRLGLLAASAWAAVLTFAALVAVALWGANMFWLSTGALVLLASLQLLGAAVLTRERRYRALAAANFVQGASLGVVQLLLGFVSADVGSLLTGFGMARVAWLVAISGHRREKSMMTTLWRKNSRFAALAGGSALLNSLTSSLPILLTSAFYGTTAVGQLAIGIRILTTPLGIISQSAASANIGEAGRMLRQGDSGVTRLVWRGMRDLFIIGLVPCGIAGATGSWVVPLVLGKRWHEAGTLLGLLAAGTLAQFVAVPFSQLLNMTGNNRQQLLWDTGRFGVTVSSMCIPWSLGLSPEWAIGSWSVALTVIYGASIRLTTRAVTRYTQAGVVIAAEAELPANLRAGA
jgi:O-antigen/teichoic acid export membrane protein